MSKGAAPHPGSEINELRQRVQELQEENKRLRSRIDQIRGMAEANARLSVSRQLSDIRDACDAALNDS